MTEITLRGKRRQIPGSLDELTTRQYETWLALVLAFHNGMMDLQQLTLQWMAALAGLKGAISLYTDEIRTELEQQLEQLDAFFSLEPDGSRRPSLRTGRNLLPRYREWQGPGDMFNGLTFGSFIEAHSLLRLADQADGNDRERAYRDVATVLYRWTGEGAAPQPPILLTAHAVNYFASVWSLIQDGPVEINGSPIDFRIIFATGQSEGRHPTDDRTGWTGVAMEAAKDGLFGTLPQVMQTDFWDIMIHLYRCKYDYIHNKTKQTK